jgi:hypothetical protein
MVMEGPPVRRFDVLVLTPYFQASGKLETVGDALQFINDPARHSLSLHDAMLTPIAPDSTVSSLQRPHVYVRKLQIAMMCFTSPEGQEAIRTLARRELLAAYTPVAVFQGYFHMGAEARLEDFLDLSPAEMIPVSEAHVFPLVGLPEPLPEGQGLLLLGRGQLQFFHEV